MTFPEGIKKLEVCAIYQCENLTFVRFPSNEDTIFEDYGEYWGSWGMAVSGCFKTDGTVLTGYYGPGCNKLILPEGITEIADDVFNDTQRPAGMFYIDEIIFPESLKKIGNRAFYQLGAYPGSGTRASVTVNLPSGLEYIGERAFDGVNTREITIPSSVRFIGASAFANTGITRAVIENGVAEIPEKCFYNARICEMIVGEFIDANGTVDHGTTVIPKSVKKIGSQAFAPAEKQTGYKFVRTVRVPQKTIVASDTFENTDTKVVSY